jgi:hypothetical protein
MFLVYTSHGAKSLADTCVTPILTIVLLGGSVRLPKNGI